MYSERIGKAIEIAAMLHDKQYRKNPERKIPYISHPFSVGMMLANYGYKEDVVIAGILHDTVEDTGYTLNEIREEFGTMVASLVKKTSEEDKSLPWEERKKLYMEVIKNSCVEAKAISCCDKIHNMKSIINSTSSGGNIWQNFKRGKEAQVDRFTKMLEIFKGPLCEEMVAQYEEALNKLKKV